MFAVLPSGFPKLQFAVQNLRKISIERPPDVRALGVRLRAQYKSARASGYKSLLMSSMRKIPFAYFMDVQPCLSELESTLVSRYWAEALPAAMRQARRSKRWYSPIFFTYCQQFHLQSSDFRDFASRALSALDLHSDDLYVQRMQRLQKDLSFFQPNRVGPILAIALLESSKTMSQALEANFLWPEFVDTPMGEHTFSCALDLGPRTMMKPDLIDRILKWSRNGEQPRYPAQRVQLANALLDPWYGVGAPEATKTQLVNYFVKHYRDPRLLGPGNPGHQWQGVSQKAIDTMRRWLAGDTLRGFMQILERTADSIWRYRQKFWMAYYDAGHIEEAWLVLGDEAALRARQIFTNQPAMTYGRFTGGATAQQSVLLLKMGGLVFSEWSHNGSLRAFYDRNPQAPSLYAKFYNGNELREPVSLDFHDGQNMNPQLTHAASDYGTWQRKARDFINRETGQYLGDKAITL